ncbi:hypothetical protein BVX98_04635 [bacterium F11]|nr:hypothetical protein BVX98_04635 [bacterium F11]
MEKKTFLFGATSVIGWNLMLADKKKKLVPFCNSHARLPSHKKWNRFNLEEEAAYQTLFLKESPALLIHCGGICDVDKCEDEPDWAHHINVKGIDHLLTYLPDSVRLVYISSDHVFGGGLTPFDEKSKTAPISVYGQTRVLAEQKILKRANSLVLRVGLAIGPGATQKTGHLNWLHYRKQKGLPLTIVKDEFRSVVWAKDLANRILDYSRSSICGLRHITAKRAVSRLELAEYLNRRFRIGATFSVRTRKEQPVPHLGRVELKTLYRDSLAKSLPAVVSS